MEWKTERYLEDPRPIGKPGIQPGEFTLGWRLKQDLRLSMRYVIPDLILSKKYQNNFPFKIADFGSKPIFLLPLPPPFWKMMADLVIPDFDSSQLWLLIMRDSFCFEGLPIWQFSLLSSQNMIKASLRHVNRQKYQKVNNRKNIKEKKVKKSFKVHSNYFLR